MSREDAYKCDRCKAKFLGRGAGFNVYVGPDDLGESRHDFVELCPACVAEIAVALLTQKDLSAAVGRKIVGFLRGDKLGEIPGGLVPK